MIWYPTIKTLLLILNLGYKIRHVYSTHIANIVVSYELKISFDRLIKKWKGSNRFDSANGTCNFRAQRKGREANRSINLIRRMGRVQFSCPKKRISFDRLIKKWKHIDQSIWFGEWVLWNSRAQRKGSHSIGLSKSEWEANRSIDLIQRMGPCDFRAQRKGSNMRLLRLIGLLWALFVYLYKLSVFGTMLNRAYYDLQLKCDTSRNTCVSLDRKTNDF